jgi:hypothetical protein
MKLKIKQQSALFPLSLTSYLIKSGFEYSDKTTPKTDSVWRPGCDDICCILIVLGVCFRYNTASTMQHLVLSYFFDSCAIALSRRKNHTEPFSQIYSLTQSTALLKTCLCFPCNPHRNRKTHFTTFNGAEICGVKVGWYVWDKNTLMSMQCARDTECGSETGRAH